MRAMQIRSATAADAAAVRTIYAPIVEHTAVSFEAEVPPETEMARRIEAALSQWAWLVASVNGVVAGYAYGSPHRPRAAYRFSVETSAYVAEAYRRQGIARQLYEALLSTLAERGYANAYAGIALPNDPSIACHRAVGFMPVGTFSRVGFKFDRWHDVTWFQRPLDRSP